MLIKVKSTRDILLNSEFNLNNKIKNYKIFDKMIKENNKRSKEDGLIEIIIIIEKT
jgi:hypothetical protein